MPIKEKLPSSKLHLMLLGAISFQSKANKLPQSTTQVLINIQTFAFKSSPVYRSFPSICETWSPLCLQKLLFVEGPGLNAHMRQILQRAPQEEESAALCLFSVRLELDYISASHLESPWEQGGAAPKSQYWTCVGGQRKFLIIHMDVLSPTSWSTIACFILISNIWGNEPL